MSSYVFDKVIEVQNIGLFQHKKDACNICTAFDIKNLSQKEKEEHDSLIKETRMEKEKDKMSENEIFTMDPQSVLLCQKSNVSSLYYKSKLIVHNFTLYVKEKMDTVFYGMKPVKYENGTIENVIFGNTIEYTCLC
jgi:hypothetical protein